MSANVISWNTAKVVNGYRWDVYSIGYKVDRCVLQSGIEPTRARAMARAKKWKRYYNGNKLAGIVRDLERRGLLEDRREYSVEDLARSYPHLSEVEAACLRALIQNKFA